MQSKMNDYTFLLIVVVVLCLFLGFIFYIANSKEPFHGSHSKHNQRISESTFIVQVPRTDDVSRGVRSTAVPQEIPSTE